jgi:hypothetical protein
LLSAAPGPGSPPASTYGSGPCGCASCRERQREEWAAARREAEAYETIDQAEQLVARAVTSADLIVVLRAARLVGLEVPALARHEPEEARRRLERLGVIEHQVRGRAGELRRRGVRPSGSVDGLSRRSA